MNRNSDSHPALRGRETVLMLDQPATRRYHLTRDCPHLKGASTLIREVSIDDRDVERALLCTDCVSAEK
ncbi:hypothetical protein [Halalkalicoccus salilacus]|uniref:hypothetical protein n=1 Tax=Halalkalicoccus salilacus TaxID=3117459 RepID=UPI00300EE3ED